MTYSIQMVHMKYNPSPSDSEVNGLQLFQVTVVREAGVSPVTGEFLGREEETLQIIAASEQDAYKRSLFLSQIRFSGQKRRTLVNGMDHFDETI